jgi:tRNA pseudouridine38-40 synthase
MTKSVMLSGPGSTTRHKILTMMERNIRLLIAYDGTGYQGWQRQKEAPTIQGSIETVLRQITQSSVHLLGAGRTDAGVHAWGQVANFRTTSEMTLFKIDGALKALLPRDILIRQVKEVESDFHARFSSQAKIYDYHIWNRQPFPPFFRHYVWFVKEPLSWPLIKAGLSLLKGEHDFSSFQTQGSQVSDALRNIYRADLSQTPWGALRLRFKANGYLRHMVRNMVGLLIRVGLKRISLREFEGVILAKDRSLAGEMAPAGGLFLRKVFYLKPDQPTIS